MERSAWLTRKARGKAELAIPRRFLVPYLTTLNCDLSIGEVHQVLNQLAQTGYLEVRLASDLDGYLVTTPPPSQIRG